MGGTPDDHDEVRAPASAIKIRTRERIKFGEWNHIVMSYDGSGKAAVSRST